MIVWQSLANCVLGIPDATKVSIVFCIYLNGKRQLHCWNEFWVKQYIKNLVPLILSSLDTKKRVGWFSNVLPFCLFPEPYTLGKRRLLYRVVLTEHLSRQSTYSGLKSMAWKNMSFFIWKVLIWWVFYKFPLGYFRIDLHIISFRASPSSFP